MNVIATDKPKFADPTLTADGQARAHVGVDELRTVWFNTGTLCNLTCENCYIESSPSNDSLVYLSRAEVQTFLAEIRALELPVREIGFTGGEPFMNPDFVGMLEDCLAEGYEVLVLTNAMRPMMKCATPLAALNDRFPGQLTVRVSIDHYDEALHCEERGKRAWKPMIRGLRWLFDNGFRLHVAGRTLWGDSEADLRAGFARLFAEVGVVVDAESLIVFPEMDPDADVPEITTQCWEVLGVDPNELMCASSRMVVKRKGSRGPEVVSCTLLPYADEFSMGRTLKESLRPVALNHPYCAEFCVLGGGSCSG